MSLSPTAADLQQRLVRVLAELWSHFPQLGREQLALSWRVYRADGSTAATASYRADAPFYPASLVKLFYLVHCHALLEDGLLEDSVELQRALRDMIVDSSNDATGLIIDLISDTTSGPPLSKTAMCEWASRRNATNRYFQSYGWPELDGCNLNQKTWGDGPYGREREFLGDDYANRNSLTAAAVMRLFEAIIYDRILTPERCRTMRALLWRDLDPASRSGLDNYNQIDGFFGEGLPSGCRYWSKSGDTSTVCHDAAYIVTPGDSGAAVMFLLVAFSEGRRPRQIGALPWLAWHCSMRLQLDQ